MNIDTIKNDTDLLVIVVMILKAAKDIVALYLDTVTGNISKHVC